MRILVFLLALLSASPARSIEMIGFGGACGTQSAVISQATGDGYYSLWAEATRGEAITVTETITLYSITVRGNVTSGGSCNLDLRIGTSNDLTSYTAEATQLACVDATDRDYEFIFTQPGPTLSPSTTYYFGVAADSADAPNAFNLVRISSGSAYTGGSVWNVNASATLWNMDEEIPTRDLYFIVKKCN